jgi:hypothetical protein
MATVTRSALVVVFAFLGCRRPAPIAADPVDASAQANPSETPLRPTHGFLHASTKCSSCLAAGDCGIKYAACVADPACLAHLACIDGCDGPAGSKCFGDCAMRDSYETLVRAEAFLFCACCRGNCTESCGDTCARYSNTAGGPVGAGCTFPGFEHAGGPCNECIEHAHISSAGATKEWEDCEGPCMDEATCVSRCKDASCVVACRPGPAATAYLKKSCAVCAAVCAPRCALLP